MKLFIDSSVLFSAVCSATGGSAKIFEEFKKFDLITSSIVLGETEKNIQKKLTNYHLDRFDFLLTSLQVKSVILNQKIIKQALDVITEKDSLILAQAKKSKSDYLVTLDIKDFHKDRVKDFFLPGKIVTPKMLFDDLKI